jgi:glyoxylase-like metal-dependent hydrolase (beta-lactamase superfamily II)
MRIEIFQSSHGDCLLLESADGKRILCDGGMRNAMEEFVAPALDELRQADPNRPIDLVYISHIDADHIGGVVQLLQDAVEWKVHDHHVAQGDDFDPPDRPRPPRISHIWHNAFKE